MAEDRYKLFINCLFNTVIETRKIMTLLEQEVRVCLMRDSLYTARGWFANDIPIDVYSGYTG